MDEIKKAIRKSLEEKYPGHYVNFSPDFDASDIVAVEIYDIPDDKCIDVKNFIWTLIEEYCQCTSLAFAPCVYSHSKTAEFYPEWVKTV